MANNNFTVRAGFTVCVNAPNANHPSAVVSAAGATVSLSDTQVEGHLHKLEPFDAAATTKIAAVAGRVHVGTPTVY